MSPTLELADRGLIWRNSVGLVTARIEVVAGIGEVLPILRGDPPATWSIEATQHLSAVMAEVARNAGISARLDGGEPLVPRRVPSPAPDAIAPMG